MDWVLFSKVMIFNYIYMIKVIYNYKWVSCKNTWNIEKKVPFPVNLCP